MTQLLCLWQSGRQDALDQLMPLVYDQLRLLAKHHMKNESSGHTLQATELVHEAFLKLVGADISVTDRAHFYALASPATLRRELRLVQRIAPCWEDRGRMTPADWERIQDIVECRSGDNTG